MHKSRNKINKPKLGAFNFGMNQKVSFINLAGGNLFEGGQTARDTPGPIPNPEVKTRRDWSWHYSMSGACQTLPSQKKSFFKKI